MSNTPNWLKPDKLAEAVGEIPKFDVKLPENFRTITTYKCASCRLSFTTPQIEAQLRKAARTGQRDVECPGCAGALTEVATAVLRDTRRLVDRAERYAERNEAIQRGVNTWVDKAIYGRLVQALGDYVESLGVITPQIRFQRALRAAKAADGSVHAKAAEFSVEFADDSNVRTRILITAGLSNTNEFIIPKTFRTLSGSEYPLNAKVMSDLMRSKVFDKVVADYSISPLHFKEKDPTRFREISAGSKKLTKYADSMMSQTGQPASGDLGAATFATPDEMNQYIETSLGVSQLTNPQAFTQLQTMLTPKITGQPSAPAGGGMQPTPQPQGDNMGQVPVLAGVKEGEITSTVPMEQVGPTQYIPEQKMAIITQAIDAGLSFEETYDQVMSATGLPLSLDEYQILGTQSVNAPQEVVMAAAARLIALADEQMESDFSVTPDQVQEEYKSTTDSMSFSEAREWVDAYVGSFNTDVKAGRGHVLSKKRAIAAANHALSRFWVKLSLRDKTTLVPVVDPDPELHMSPQSEFAEPKFDGKYEDMDGGIPEMKDRGVMNSFRGASRVSLRTTAEATGADLDPEEVGQNPINRSRLVTMIQDYVRAGNIPPTKIDLHKLKDGGYTVKELHGLLDTLKTDDSSAMYPVAHAGTQVDLVKLAKDSLQSWADEQKLKAGAFNDKFDKFITETPDQIGKFLHNSVEKLLPEDMRTSYEEYQKMDPIGEGNLDFNQNPTPNVPMYSQEDLMAENARLKAEIEAMKTQQAPPPPTDQDSLQQHLFNEAKKLIQISK